MRPSFVLKGTMKYLSDFRSKIIFLFQIVCTFSTVPSSTAFIHVINALTGAVGAVSSANSVTFETNFGEGNNIQAQIDFYRAISNTVLDIIGSVIHKKVDFFLALKKTLVNVMVQGIGYFRYFVLNNPEFVHNAINSGSELLKLLLTNKPHFVVPHVLEIIKQVTEQQDKHDQYGTYNRK